MKPVSIPKRTFWTLQLKASMRCVAIAFYHSIFHPSAVNAQHFSLLQKQQRRFRSVNVYYMWNAQKGVSQLNSATFLFCSKFMPYRKIPWPSLRHKHREISSCLDIVINTSRRVELSVGWLKSIFEYNEQMMVKWSSRNSFYSYLTRKNHTNSLLNILLKFPYWIILRLQNSLQFFELQSKVHPRQKSVRPYHIFEKVN